MALLAVAVVGLSRSDFGRGFGAAIAIYDRDHAEIVRTNYRADVLGATMEVYLAVGVDPSRGHDIGCRIVATEIAKAGLSQVRWVVFAANGQQVATSAEPCP